VLSQILVDSESDHPEERKYSYYNMKKFIIQY
jgi:hypothetical protein